MGVDEWSGHRGAIHVVKGNHDHEPQDQWSWVIEYYSAGRGRGDVGGCVGGHCDQVHYRGSGHGSAIPFAQGDHDGGPC